MQQRQQFQHKKNSLRKMSISKCKKKYISSVPTQEKFIEENVHIEVQKNIYIRSSKRLVFLPTGTHGLLVTNGCPRHEGRKTGKTMSGASCVTVPRPCSSNLVLFEFCRGSSRGTRVHPKI
ncbi:hypothetical protein TNCV_1749201 [Trichonephila clavipes]|nr:hypothetical protein TNCV_1749201 [Trichonephila clavipes]